jgi:putative membrane protein (TIGR04086 family)
MNVRWTAVLTGFVVAFLLSQLLLAFSTADFIARPDIARSEDLVMIALLILSAGIGGYIAGRMAGVDRMLNGLLVGVVGILFTQIAGSASMPRVLVIASAVACLASALGGMLSRYPPLRRSRSPNRR